MENIKARLQHDPDRQLITLDGIRYGRTDEVIAGVQYGKHLDWCAEALSAGRLVAAFWST